MQHLHADEDGLRIRSLDELLNDDDDLDQGPTYPGAVMYGMDYNADMDDDDKSVSDGSKSRRLAKMCALGVVVVVVVGIAIAMITVVPSVERLGPSHKKTPGPGRETAESKRMKKEGVAENLSQGAVSSDHAICSSLGNHILNYKGGNVVDAGVATAICLGVVNPSSSGIGGGAFILINIDPNSKDHSRNKRPIPPIIDSRDPATHDIVNGKILTVVDARETAPESSSPSMFNGLPDHVSTVGGLAIAVPGEIRGLEYAHARYGSLSWWEVIEPSVRLAKEGWPISSFLEGAIRQHMGQRWDFMPLRNMLSKDGAPLEQHDVMHNPALGTTLEAIAEHGSDVLYDGPLTERFVQDVRSSGGILSESDMRRYRPTLRSPLIGKNVGGYTLVGAPPPSSGGATVIGAARYLSGFRPNGRVPPSHHRMAEAMKHAFAIRMSLSDPDFHSGKVADAVKDLVQGDYMHDLRRNSSDAAVLPLSRYGGEKWSLIQDTPVLLQGVTQTIADFGEGDRRRQEEISSESSDRQLRGFNYLNDKGTTHVSVMDIHGNAVAITSSLNTYFGSGVLSESTGILLNSQMDDFATPLRPNYYGLYPSESNYIQPGKKPLSSMSPTLVFKKKGGNAFGELFMALGASGGPKIISAVLQVFWNYAFTRMDLFESVISPRIHDQLLYHDGPATLFESTKVEGMEVALGEEAQAELRGRGHNLIPISYTGAVQVVAIDKSNPRTLTAVADARKGGKPGGA